MRIIKHLWFHLVMTLTAWLPDLRPVIRLRGFLARPAFRRCGRNLQIAHGVTVNSSYRLEIGNDVYIGPGAWLHCTRGIVLEDEVLIAPYVVIITGDHQFHNRSYRFSPPGRSKPIRIGRGSWIAAHATITGGVTIGRGTLLAANAVAVTDLPDYCIAGGVPARVIRQRTAEELGECGTSGPA